MPRYRVSWRHEVIQYWIGTVDADTEEDALAMVEDGEIDNEELMDESGVRVFDCEVEGEDDE